MTTGMTLLIVVIVVALLVAAAFMFRRPERPLPEIICPNMNCGYKGTVCRQEQQSAIVWLVLFCCGVWPAFLYEALVPKYKYSCPECKTKLEM